MQAYIALPVYPSCKMYLKLSLLLSKIYRD